MSPRAGMPTALDCLPCLVRQGLDAVRFVTSDSGEQEQLGREVLAELAAADLGLSPPQLAQRVQRRLRERAGVTDPYWDTKRRFDAACRALLPELAEAVARAPEPLLAAARCAVAANAFDVGAPGTVDEEQIASQLRAAPATPLWGDEAALIAAVSRARTILYLADNAGELVVDRLLVEALGPRRVTVVVRGGPVLNDVTLADAREAGLLELVEVVDNGSDAPGTVLAECRPELHRRFLEADLVLAKGQGNFETLLGALGELFFLFKVKCPAVSRHVGARVGTLALVHQREGRLR